MRAKALAAVISVSLAVSGLVPAAGIYAAEPVVYEEAGASENSEETTEEVIPEEEDEDIVLPGAADEKEESDAGESGEEQEQQKEDETVLPGKEDTPKADSSADSDLREEESEQSEEAESEQSEETESERKEVTDPSEEPEPTEEQAVLPEEEASEKAATAADDGKKLLAPAESSTDNSRINPKKTLIDGKYYIIYEDGSHHTGWFKYKSGKKAYCDPKNDGALLTGIAMIGSKGYQFNSKGTLVQNKEGVKTINGKIYYVRKSGKLAKGWMKTDEGKMYFQSKDCTAKTGGARKIGGKYYLFNDKGILFTSGTPMYKGYKYWVKANGTLGSGWAKIGDWKLYYSKKNFRAFTGIRKVEGHAYYFNSDGIVMGVGGGTPVIDGHKYWTETDGTLRTGWMEYNGMKCYFIPGKYYCAIGTIIIGGKKYTFNDDGVLIPTYGRQLRDGQMYYYDDYGDLYRNTWVVFNGERIYVDGNGVGLADLSDQIPGPYTLYVDRANCVVTAYSGGTPVRSMLCSVGVPGMSTPGGNWYIHAQYILKQLMGPSWGQYASNVDGGSCGGIYFHSVATGSPSDPWHTVPINEYNKLGQPASHGCIRLCVRDAKWIYDNCSIGTTVIIGDNFSMPFGRPFLTKIDTPVDPTDPAIWQ